MECLKFWIRVAESAICALLDSISVTFRATLRRMDEAKFSGGSTVVSTPPKASSPKVSGARLVAVCD